MGGETDGLLATIARYESDTKEANAKCDQHDCDIRDLSKKIQGYECDFDETLDKLNKALTTLEEKEKLFKAAEEDVSASTRRIMLMEEEAKKADSLLAETVTKLAMSSKEAVGENMKQLEISAEKAQEREDKLQDKILQLIDRFKVAEARYEYGEMNITKLNHRIDDIEDEIYRE